jgi:hypothetical protein
MARRIREGMAPEFKSEGPLGGPGKIVEADTTFIGGKEANKHRNKHNSKNIGGMGKQIVHTLVERNGKAPPITSPGSAARHFARSSSNRSAANPQV